MKTFARCLLIFAGGLLGVCSICTVQATSGLTIDNGNATGPGTGAFEFGGLPASVPPPPIANPATYIGSNSFTANWRTVSGATGYRLDVSLNSSFSTYIAGYQNLSVGNSTSSSVT